MLKVNPDLPERFWKKVDKSKPCWNWTGAWSNGYGMYRHEGKIRMVQRIISEPIPTNKKILKSCGHIWCINPEHFSYDPYDAEFEPVRATTIRLEELPQILLGGTTDHLNIPPSAIATIRKYILP